MASTLEHKERVLRHGSLVQTIRDWNAAHSIGTHVVYRRDIGGDVETTTRSDAQMLGGHSAVIWLDGIAGCVALERVKPRGS